MKPKLSCILLVDDDKNCHFFHRRIIMLTDCAEYIQEAFNGAEALDYLKNCRDGRQPWPELILLDVNMPKMNGWEFLDVFQTFSDAEKSQTILIVLTSSLNPDDLERALQIPGVKGYENKIFTKGNFRKLLDLHFPHYHKSEQACFLDTTEFRNGRSTKDSAGSTVGG